MEINNDDENIIIEKPIDQKKEKIKKAIEDITEIINKYENDKNEQEEQIINEIITYINENQLDCFEILQPSKETLAHLYCYRQIYFHLKIYLLTIEKILNNKNKLDEYLLKEDITKMNIFDCASKLGDTKIFEILHKYLKNNNSLLESLIIPSKKNIFHIAAEENKIISLLYFYEFYNNNNSVLNVKDFSQKTPLIIACYQNNFEYAETLINLGADITLTDKNNKNCLFYAVESNNPSLVKYLILMGMDKNKIDNKNKKAADYTKDGIIHNILDNKNLFQTLFLCQLQYKSLRGQKLHIYYICLLIIILVLQSLITSLYIFLDKKEECSQDLYSLNYNIEYSFLCISILFELFGIIYYIFIHIKFKSNNIQNEIQKTKSLYELYLTNKNICAKCHIIMKSNTKHCFACDKCIENWDHHCFWLNICINKENKKYFIFFLIQLFLIILSNGILSIQLNIDIIKYPKIYYGFNNGCIEEQNFDFVSIIILIIFIIYFLVSIYMLLGSLMPYVIEFCSELNKDKNQNIIVDENKSPLMSENEINRNSITLNIKE